MIVALAATVMQTDAASAYIGGGPYGRLVLSTELGSGICGECIDV